MGEKVLDGGAFEEAGLFGEGVEHFSSGIVGGGVADVVAVRDGH
jgi:hypothetical protein